MPHYLISSCYIGLMVYLLNSRYSPLFLMAAVMEVRRNSLIPKHRTKLTPTRSLPSI